MALKRFGEKLMRGVSVLYQRTLRDITEVVQVSEDFGVKLLCSDRWQEAR